MQDHFGVKMIGHVLIEDTTDEQPVVIRDVYNAVHPQNMARVISRALSNESNFAIKRMAFGNGGTSIDAALNITFNPANDGQSPDTRTFDSRLYNETYSEIVDETDLDVGTGPGADPGSDSFTGNVTSTELGVLSEVVISVELNADEPIGQVASAVNPVNNSFDTSYTFDEIGLYTDGLPPFPVAGYQDVQVGTPASTDSTTDTTLASSTFYDFEIIVDGGTPATISFTTPAGGPFTYGDLAEAINTGDVTWNAAWAGSNPLPSGATVSITDTSGSYPTIANAQTNGFLRFTSGTTGASSSVALSAGPSNDMFAALNSPGGAMIQSAVAGTDAGVANDSGNPSNEVERLLTHVVFSPVQKTADRSLRITYTITVAVARTQ